MKKCEQIVSFFKLPVLNAIGGDPVHQDADKICITLKLNSFIRSDTK